ncbi:MAG: archaellum operon transcriptional activator EarA family protein [Patescibacteria group bacterium]
MSKFILDNLFGSKIRVKLLKFLFRNYPTGFAMSELAKRTREPLDAVQKELALLRKIGAVIKQ